VNKQIQMAFICLLILTGCTGTMPKLGVENGQLMQCPKTPNCVNSQAKDEEHFIEPIRISGSPLEAKNYLLNILNELDRSSVILAEDNYIRAQFISRVFRFVDDVEFLILEIRPKETMIHVRSASRVGRSDFGVNRKRIEQIRNKFSGMN